MSLRLKSFDFLPLFSGFSRGHRVNLQTVSDGYPYCSSRLRVRELGSGVFVVCTSAQRSPCF